MKAISIKQPWVNQIMSGKKKYEYRSWSTNHRGDLLICSSASPKIEGMLSGHALCIVSITDVIKVDYTNYRALGRALPPNYGETLYAWKIESVRPVKPFPVKGKLNFYHVDDELIERMQAPCMTKEEIKKRLSVRAMEYLMWQDEED